MAKYIFWIQGPFNYKILLHNYSLLLKSEINFKIIVCSNDYINFSKLKNVESIQIEDPGQDVNEKIKLNYSRQYSTTSPILHQPNILDAKLICKLRSDIRIENHKKFVKLLDYLGENDKIVVSSYSTMHVYNAFNYSFHISDWIYIGKPNLILELISKENRSSNVVCEAKNRIYLEHWVGIETCEQAMIDKSIFLKRNFYEIIYPINILRHGLKLEKYNYLFFPRNWRELKTVIFARLSTFTELDYKLIRLIPFSRHIIANIKTCFIKLIINK
ncbi:MAG: hypothetical protein RLZZ585_89 [Bacteroidota bacterium]|jgi:hypothetical protein